MALPDRFIRGTCPRCKAEDQYGDSCEVCSATYQPTDLINPYCSTCRSTPVLKQSEHYFFKLADYEQQLKNLIAAGYIQKSVANKLDEWFKAGLEGLGHLPRRPILRLQNPRRTGQILLRLARCTHRLYGLGQKLLRQKQSRFRRRLEQPRLRALPLHRQRHYVFPRPVLARDADGRRLQNRRTNSSSTASSPSTARK